MGTRSMTIVYEDDAELVNMYRQYDGYVSGHGHELAKFLASGRIVNGLGADDVKVFNGMGCLAAQMVAHFKTEPGGIYLLPGKERDAGTEYRYEVSNFFDKVSVKVSRGYGEKWDVIFTGTPNELEQWEEVSE